MPKVFKRALLVCLMIVLVLLAILVVKTLTFSSHPGQVEPVAEVSLDGKSVDRLSRAVQISTVSSLQDKRRRDENLSLFHAFLRESFPRVHQSLSLTLINEFALLYEWPGSDASLKPALLLSHQDVVPIEPGTEADWQYPPFSGEQAEGYVWGRGAWDDKSTLMASLEALEILLAEGAKPKRTLMLAFGHDEEVGGEQGAAAIAQYLEQQGKEFAFVLDEGAVIGMGLVPGVEQPVALIATAEKGYLTLKLTTQGQGGHSSAPPAITTVGRLAQAVSRLQAQPLPPKMTEPVRDMFAVLGPQMSFEKRFWLANLWLFEPMVVSKMADDRSTQAHVRTTTAPTMLTAGVKENVLPQAAEAVVNFRLLPGQSRDSVIEAVRKIINDDQVAVSEAGVISSEPSPVSNSDSYGYRQLAKTIRQVNPDVLVAPALLFGATDSRYYTGLSDQVFRFTPIRIAPSDFKRIHGTNERIAIEDYKNAIRFYHQLVTNVVINPEQVVNE